MLYFLEQGPIEKIIIRQCLKEKRDFPEKIKNAPELINGLDIFWDAFMELSDSRPSGMGYGCIPWVVINQYCRYHKFSADQEEAMHYHLKEMDLVFISHHARKQP